MNFLGISQWFWLGMIAIGVFVIVMVAVAWTLGSVEVRDTSRTDSSESDQINPKP